MQGAELLLQLRDQFELGAQRQQRYAELLRQTLPACFTGLSLGAVGLAQVTIVAVELQLSAVLGKAQQAGSRQGVV